MLSLGGKRSIAFDAKRDIIYNRRSRLPFHANGMTLKAFSGDTCLEERTYYSVGGGFIVDEETRLIPKEFSWIIQTFLISSELKCLLELLQPELKTHQRPYAR